MLQSAQVNRSTKTVGISAASIAALAASAWGLWPAVDAAIFFESEATQTLAISMRQHYQTRMDIAEIRRDMAAEATDRAAWQAEMDYYRDRLRELDAGEK